MSIQKKSLISALKTTKKANVASAPAVEAGKSMTSMKKPQHVASMKKPAHVASMKKPAHVASMKKPAHVSSFKKVLTDGI